MEREKLIEIKSKSERGGALAKYYAPTESVFAIESHTAKNPLPKFPSGKKTQA